MSKQTASCVWECSQLRALCKQCCMALQAWTQKLKTGMSKRAASGESMEAAHDDGAASPQRMEQQRSHGISSKALHHGATAYPSEMQLQQVRPPHTRSGMRNGWTCPSIARVASVHRTVLNSRLPREQTSLALPHSPA